MIVQNGKEFNSQKFTSLINSGSSFVGEDSNAMIHALSSDKRHTTYSNWNLPIHSEPDTTVLSESVYEAYSETIASNNNTFMLHLGDDLPNENVSPKKRGVLVDNWKIEGAKLVALIERLFGESHYVRPYVNQKPCYRQCGGGKTTNKGSQTESGGGGSGHQGSSVTGYASASGSSLVTGLGAFGGGGGFDGGDDPWRNRPIELPRSHYDDFNGFEDELSETFRRMPVLTTPTDAPMETTSYFTRSDSHMSVFTENPETPTTTPTQPTVYPAQESSSEIGNAFDLIHLMSRTRPTCGKLSLVSPTRPSVGLVAPSNPMPRCQMVSPVPSPSTSTIPMQVTSPSVPSPSPSPTPSPATPNRSPGFFKVKSYIEEEERLFELSVPQDIPQLNRILPLRALFYTTNLHWQYSQCLEQSCDLKVSHDIRAKFCRSSFEPEESRVVFSIPKECKSTNVVCTCFPLCVYFASNGFHEGICTCTCCKI